MNIDRFANWLFTACGLLIIIVITGQIIDNLRVTINMTLIMIAFLFSGCVVYESISYIYKKFKSTKELLEIFKKK
jgi:hypothetical protein